MSQPVVLDTHDGKYVKLYGYQILNKSLHFVFILRHYLQLVELFRLTGNQNSDCTDL